MPLQETRGPPHEDEFTDHCVKRLVCRLSAPGLYSRPPISLQGEGYMPDLQRAGGRVLTPEALTVILTARVTADRDPTGHRRLTTCLSPLLAHTGVLEAQACSQSGRLCVCLFRLRQLRQSPQHRTSTVLVTQVTSDVMQLS